MKRAMDSCAFRLLHFQCSLEGEPQFNCIAKQKNLCVPVSIIILGFSDKKVRGDTGKGFCPLTHSTHHQHNTISETQFL